MEDWEMRPSITMPRWACRTFAEITAVRVERVQDITEEDAKKEGVNSEDISILRMKGTSESIYVRSFAFLWQSIYANWDANWFVWVYSIKLIKP